MLPQICERSKKNTKMNYAKHDIIFEQKKFGNILKNLLEFR